MEKIKGLTNDEVLAEIQKGNINGDNLIPTKSIKDIIRTNTLTFFNLINACLAALVIIVGSFESALFMGVIICNIFIGTIQEIRAKLITDKLSLISEPHAKAIRDGALTDISARDIVLGDTLLLKAGMQICTDCKVIEGECEVNESLVTGESDALLKARGNSLLSGSFVVSGEIYAVVTAVGKDSFANKITQGAGYLKKPNSKMFRAMDKIVKKISICILPIMLILFYKSLFITGEPIKTAVTSVVAAVIGMIPEGLVLLISIVMAVSAIRISKHKTLVQDMYCAETLARVDVLCLDKTGTITEGKMLVEAVIPLVSETEAATITKALSEISGALHDNNQTAEAIRQKYNETASWTAEKTYPFSSARKWSGVHFKGKGSYVMGAYEFVFPNEKNRSSEISEKIKEHSSNGQRVIVLAGSPYAFEEKSLPPSLKALALIIISDIIREEAPETLKYFKDQNVTVKIISGDNPLTVKNVAMRAGVKDSDKYIDMSTVSDDNLSEAALKYTVFGRVTPDQKLAIIKALKNNGHTVAMTGDGANDVLALKEADCSIAMQSGSEAARNVSNLILLDSNFASIPKVVEEGRRSINNVERSATLFLTKTVYAFILALIYVFVLKPYPFVSIQMTLINALFIGIPSFLLALEPNYSMVRGEFIENVLKKAIPYGSCSIICISLLTILGHIYHFTPGEVRSVATVLLGVVSFLILCRICMPFNKRRAFMVIVLGIAFSLAVNNFEKLLSITEFSLSMLMVTVLIIAVAVAVVVYLPRLSDNIIMRYKELKRKKNFGK